MEAQEEKNKKRNSEIIEGNRFKKKKTEREIVRERKNVCVCERDKEKAYCE